jgi:hypothetical protein
MCPNDMHSNDTYNTCICRTSISLRLCYRYLKLLYNTLLVTFLLVTILQEISGQITLFKDCSSPNCIFLMPFLLMTHINLVFGQDGDELNWLKTALVTLTTFNVIFMGTGDSRIGILHF